MTQQTQALRLADALDLYATGDKHQKDIEDAAAELRRLQSVETESKERILRLEGALTKEVAINAQLLEALEQLHRATEGVSINDYSEEAHDIAVSRARAAIAAAKGES